jgi:hypothetical protein
MTRDKRGETRDERGETREERGERRNQLRRNKAKHREQGRQTKTKIMMKLLILKDSSWGKKIGSGVNLSSLQS